MEALFFSCSVQCLVRLQRHIDRALVWAHHRTVRSSHLISPNFSKQSITMFTTFFVMTPVIRHKVCVPSTWIHAPGSPGQILLCIYQLLLNTSGRTHVDGDVLVLRFRQLNFLVWSTCSSALVDPLTSSNRVRHCSSYRVFATLLLGS